MITKLSLGDSDEVCFGPFQLSKRRRTLLSDEGPVPLGARAFDLLTALLTEPGCLRSKQDLLDQVWPGVTVEENNLHVQIVALRRALGAQHGLIQTVPGRGYRFAGEIQPIAAASAPLPEPRVAARQFSEPVQQPLCPAEPAGLVGRQTELAELMEWLQRHRLVTITGPGGIGKTRLAVALTSLLSSRFPGGVRLIDLAPLTNPNLVEGATAAALGFRLSEDTAPAAQICDAIGQQPALIIFDNCEHLLDRVAALVASLLRHCAAVSVLATSQELLRIDGEATYRLDPLALPPPGATQVPELAGFGAIDLFVSRATAADRCFQLTVENSAAVVDICRHLDGIPLALEMAAARVPAFGIERLRVRLGERFRMLTTGSRNAAGRHRTLRDTMLWSYELLNAHDRAIFRRLGVFPGGFSAEAAAAVLADDAPDEWRFFDALGRLVDKSLVVAGPEQNPRYRLLETLRLFAVEQMQEHGEHDAFLRKHAAYYETLFAQAYEEWEELDDAIWLARAGMELDNARAAIEWALNTQDAANLAISLAGCAAWLWDKVAPLAEGRLILERAEALLSPDTPPDYAARLYRQIGVLWHTSDRARALAALLQAEALYRARGDLPNLGAVLALIGFVRTTLGAPAAANAALQEARAILTPFGQRKSLFNVTNHLAVLAAIDGDMAAAREMFILALQMTQQSGKRDDEVVVLVNLAEVEFNLGQTKAAIERTNTAIALLRDTGRRTDLGWALTNLTTYLLIDGRVQEAREAAREGLVLVRPAGGFILRICLLQWAFLAAEAGGLAEAARLAGFVKAGYRQAGETFQPTEQRLLDHVQVRLDAKLAPAELTACYEEGEGWSESQAAQHAGQLAADGATVFAHLSATPSE